MLVVPCGKTYSVDALDDFPACDLLTGAGVHLNRLRLHVPDKSGRNEVSVRRFTGRAGTAAPRDGLAVAWLTPTLKTKDGYLILSLLQADMQVCGQPTHQKLPGEPEEILTRSLIPT
jgi:hypothetical protein